MTHLEGKHECCQLCGYKTLRLPFNQPEVRLKGNDNRHIALFLVPSNFPMCLFLSLTMPSILIGRQMCLIICDKINDKLKVLNEKISVQNMKCSEGFEAVEKLLNDHELRIEDNTNRITIVILFITYITFRF